MNKVELQDLVGGALQEKFSRAFEKVVENLQDSNTSFKVKRKINITLSFVQNENRDDVTVAIDVAEKLAPQQGMETRFSIGKNLATGEVFAEEYGKQVKGQMHINEFLKQDEGEPKPADVEADEGEPVEDHTVVDFRNVSAL